MKKLNRRDFIGQASCAGMGYLTLLNTYLNFKAINGASISNSSVLDANDYKAIVCILQAGGNDSFNMLVPYEQNAYDIYQTTRGGAHISRNNLLPINQVGENINNPAYAVAPTMSGVQTLFNQRRLSFLANVGTLLKPNTTINDFENNVNVPLKLMSHSDQIQQWQSGIPSARSIKGWGGKVADIINSCNPNQNISMNISLSGTNIFQRGDATVEYAIDAESGSIGVDQHDRTTDSFYQKIRTEAVDSLMEYNYQDIFQKTYSNVIKNAIDWNEEFSAALVGSNTFDNIDFPNSFLSRQLKMIARTIDVQQALGFKRQIFFVLSGGWDHHDTLLRFHPEMIGDVSSSLLAFSQALESINMDNDVLTMTISEFGRSLTFNGDGSDHAWGGNTMVMGGPNLIHGGQIFGSYPNLVLGSNIDIGNGILIPSLSTDEYFAEVSKWFGVGQTDLYDIFPNLSEFYNNFSSYPIGFIKS